MSNFFKTLFSTTGIFIVLYILIGVSSSILHHLICHR